MQTLLLLIVIIAEAAVMRADSEVIVQLPLFKAKFRSWKGDYLHRPDSDQGVTTWSTGVGNEWTVTKNEDGTYSLMSWKGDFLHRPDSSQGVTTWN